jgi:hypothetical protein
MQTSNHRFCEDNTRGDRAMVGFGAYPHHSITDQDADVDVKRIHSCIQLYQVEVSLEFNAIALTSGFRINRGRAHMATIAFETHHNRSRG